MGMSIVAARLPQVAVETAVRERLRINAHIRMTSPTLVTACRQAGLPMDVAETCAGLLASVIDDLVQIGQMRKTDFQRTKRKERVLAAASEPMASALRLAMAASPVNGQAAIAHWDMVCEKHELGKLAWLLGAGTETAYKYGRKLEKRT